MIVCGCGTRMRCTKTGAFIEELFDDGKPYKVWSSDCWTCQQCKLSVYSTASAPVAEHFQKAYAKAAENVAIQFGERK